MFKRTESQIMISTETAKKQAALLRTHAQVLENAAAAAEQRDAELRELVHSLETAFSQLRAHLQ